MSKEFYHPRMSLDTDDCYSFGAEAYIETLKDEALEYKGRKFIAIETYYQPDRGTAHKFTTVPGFVVGELRASSGKHGACTLVDLVVDEADKEGIRAVLKEHNFAESVDFWKPEKTV